ncbi:MAG: RAD55 family ATPase [Candidatus Thermoplasmatota archaeon]|nr:RAD55 family ATPase [Candidatus Thermoplasmatota archaeon]
MARKDRKGPGKGKKKAKVVIEEEAEEEFEAEEEEDEPGKDEEDVWEAVEWDNVGPSTEGKPVFSDDTIPEIMRDVIDQAWEDGVITDDELAILQVLKSKLNIDDETFNRIMESSKPLPTAEPVEEPDGSVDHVEEEEEYDEEEEPEEKVKELPTRKDDILKMEIPEVPMATPLAATDSSTGVPAIPKKGTGPSLAENPGNPPDMITMTASIRGSKQPLGESFDLSQKEETSFKKRCPHCRSLIRVTPGYGKNACPICGKQLVEKKLDSPALRKILDQAKVAFKEGDRATAKELYTIALAQSPGNKESMFYLQKLHHRQEKGRPTVDVRNISTVTTNSRRLDQLMKGGIQVGNQVLLKGPAFCGKEVLLDKIMASALEIGLPVIYVSSNRAMKEVMRGVLNQAPDFRRYNQDGLVRMYDLFSKYRDEKVLKEGHRIFNIEVKKDFKKFQEDLVHLLEELVTEYHGGLMIINSLSPLITQVDQNDLMKFLQVIIARSKSYRFTNIFDMAAGVHSESIENSVEYLMDGIIEFKEQDQKYSLRLKGFRNSTLTKDWVDYQHDDTDIHIVGSFMEERIL